MRFWTEEAKQKGRGAWYAGVYLQSEHRPGNVFLAWAMAGSKDQCELHADALVVCLQRLEELDPGYVEGLYLRGKNLN